MKIETKESFAEAMIRAENRANTIVNSRARECGIYCIWNPSNGKRHIGQSFNISSRRHNHYHDLRANRHQNKEMQKEFNLQGEDYFEFSVLEESSPWKLDECEDKWINHFQSNIKTFGYNGKSAGAGTARKIKKDVEFRIKSAWRLKYDPEYIRQHERSIKAWHEFLRKYHHINMAEQHKPMIQQ